MSMLKNEVEKSLESKIRTELEDVRGDVEDVNYKVDNIQGDVTELKEMVTQLLSGSPSLPQEEWRIIFQINIAPKLKIGLKYMLRIKMTLCR